MKNRLVILILSLSFFSCTSKFEIRRPISSLRNLDTRGYLSENETFYRQPPTDSQIHFDGYSIVKMWPLFPNSVNQNIYNLYSLSSFDSLLFMGGWLDITDVGPDKLYMSSISQDGNYIGKLAPLRWLNSGYEDGLIPGFHVNDPSVISIPSNNNFLIMYYTALNNRYTNLVDIVSRNWIGYAFSSDGGANWLDRGIILGQANGIDQTGAWSPSAIIEDNQEISVYYHTGAYNCSDSICDSSNPQPIRVLKSKFGADINTYQKTEVLIDMISGKSISLVNVDVQKAFNHYWLVGNSPDQTKIVLLFSVDGTHFYPYDLQEGLLINGGVNKVITPHMRVIADDRIYLAFSFASGNETRFSSTHLWEMKLAK